MATIANQRGGYFKDLTILRTANNESNTTLKDDFLKKTQNYSCQVPQMLMNGAIKLSLIDEVMFEIRLMGDGDNPPDEKEDVEFADEWIESDYKFRPTPYLSWLELSRQLERFFHKFGVTVELKGIGPVYQGEALDDEYHPFTNVGDDELDIISYGDIEEPDLETEPPAVGMKNLEQGRHIQFILEDDGRFSLQFDSFFSTKFYIVVGPQTQIKTGFPEYMFCVYDTILQTNRTHLDGLHYLFDQAGLDHVDANGDPEPRYIFTEFAGTEPLLHRFASTHSLENFDDRLSLDVVASMPVSTRVTVLNGEKPNHDFILCRFPIADYQRNASEVGVFENRLQNKNIIKEALKIGLEDMCSGNQNSTSVYLLPGKIRHMNIRLMTRYLHEGKFKTVPTNMRDGTFILKLLFTKKQT